MSGERKGLFEVYQIDLKWHSFAAFSGNSEVITDILPASQLYDDNCENVVCIIITAS
jgi:hypothetical protein